MKLHTFHMRRTLPGRAKCGGVAPQAAVSGFSSVAYVSRGLNRLRVAPAACGRRSRGGLHVNALVAVDYSQPAIWLGLGLIGGGLSLYQLRRVQPLLSRDFDIVVSSVVIFSGGILIFQGWRLDPLLLFCQLLTAGTALAWALEAIKLRKLVENEQRFDERARQYPPPMEGQGGMGLGRGIPLPPPREAEFGRWYGQPDLEYEEMPTASGQGFYGGRGQEGYGPAGGSGGYEGDEYYSREGAVPYEGYGQGEYFEEYSDRQGSRQDPRWGVVDDVESFYNRPGSVVEDVERFYGGTEEAGRQGQQEGEAAARPRDSQESGEEAGEAWPGQIYGGEQRFYPDSGPQGDGPPARQAQQGSSGGFPGYGPQRGSDSGRNDPGPESRSR